LTLVREFYEAGVAIFNQTAVIGRSNNIQSIIMFWLQQALL